MSLIQGSNRKPIDIISSHEFLDNYDRDDNNEPYAVFLEQNPDRSLQKLRFLPPPSTADTINYTYRRALYDFDAATDNPDFPQEWALGIKIMLSYELSNEQSLPLAERQLIKQDAILAERELQKFNAQSDTGPTYTLKNEYF